MRWWWWPLVVLVGQAMGGPYEKLLYADLLADYNPLVRPVLNESWPVNVKLGLDLQQIIEVNEKAQTIVTNVWLRFEWWDAFLRWEPERYGNVSEVRLPVASVWRPDILLYNSADQAFDTTYHSQAVVYADGSINWMPPGIVTSSCKIDITYFPFDDQRCQMKFGSWSNSGKQINLINDTVELSTYVLNGEWILVGAPGKRNVIKYECCPDPYYDVTFTLWIRRRTLYYNLNLVVPCILISALALLGFTLPPDSGEKISLGVTIFMSLCVTMLMVAESMPQTSDAVPLIAIYFSCIMLVVTEGLILTVVVLNFHHRRPETHEMPQYIKTLFLDWLPWLMRMRRPGQEAVGAALPLSPASPARPARSASRASKGGLLSNVLDIEEEVGALFPSAGGRRRDSGTPMPLGSVAALPPSYSELSAKGPDDRPRNGLRHAARDAGPKEATLGSLPAIYHELRFLTDRLRTEDEDEATKNDWRWAAMVADRLSLILCALFLIVCTVIFAFSAPHLFV